MLLYSFSTKFEILVYRILDFFFKIISRFCNLRLVYVLFDLNNHIKEIGKNHNSF